MSKKILIIRFSSIGDIVLTTPVVRVLHQQLNAEVHYLTKPAFALIVEANPYVSKVIPLSDDFRETISLLKTENYDHIIDLHHNLRSKRIKIALGKPSSSFHKLNFEKWLIVNFKINRLPAKHIVDRYLEAAAFTGIKKDESGLDFFIPQDIKIEVSENPGIEEPYAAIVIGAAHATKCLTTTQIAKICEYLQMPVLLLGGKQEAEKAEMIIQNTSNKNVKNACGRLDLFQSALKVKNAATIITHDTGLMHIAAALKKPQVVVWGNTIPEFGMYPYYGNENINWISFEQKGLYCRPCSKIGYQSCPEKHFRCMLDHDLQQIASAAKNLIAVYP